jgi:hypothetical protein
MGHESRSHSNAPDSVSDLTEESLQQGLSELVKSGTRLCNSPQYIHFTADTLKKYFGWTDEMIAIEFMENGIVLPIPYEC